MLVAGSAPWVQPCERTMQMASLFCDIWYNKL